MKRSVVLLLTGLLLCVWPMTVTAQNAPRGDVPQLQALACYVGEWTVAGRIGDQPLCTGVNSTVWILDGRFVQQTQELKSADGSPLLSMKTLFGWDQERGVYRNWIFLSSGDVLEGEGTWNSATRVWTWVSVSRKDGGRITTTADFSREQQEVWKIVGVDAVGQTQSTLQGTNQRQTPR